MAQSSQNTDEEHDRQNQLLKMLARRAKELVSGPHGHGGMRERLGRDPDVADFLAAFKDELGESDKGGK